MTIPAVPFGVIHPNHPIGGLDVSKYQWQIDTERAKAVGVKFLLIRAGYGVVKDEWFDRHRAEAERAHWPWAAWWYWRPHFDGKVQADKAYQVIGGIRPPMGVFGDFERNESVDPWPKTITKQQVNDSVYKMVSQLDVHYREEVGIYSSPGWWNNWILPGYNTKLRLYFRLLWVANWWMNFRYNPTLPFQWNHGDLWQISGQTGIWQKNARYIGVQGDDDLDVDVSAARDWNEFCRKYKLIGYEANV